MLPFPTVSDAHGYFKEVTFGGSFECAFAGFTPTGDVHFRESLKVEYEDNCGTGVYAEVRLCVNYVG